MKGDFNMEEYNSGQQPVQQLDTFISNIQNSSSNDFNELGLSPKKIISHAGVALFALATIVLGVQTLIEALVMNYMPEIAETDWYVWVLTAVSLVVIGFPIYSLIINRIPDSPKGEVIKLKPGRFFTIFFIGVAAMYITNF